MVTKKGQSKSWPRIVQKVLKRKTLNTTQKSPLVCEMVCMFQLSYTCKPLIICMFQLGSCLIVNHLSFNTYFLPVHRFSGLFCWKIQRKLNQLFKFRVSRHCRTSLQHLVLAGSNDFWVSFARIRRNSLEKLINGQIRSSFPDWSFPLCKLSWSTDRYDPSNMYLCTSY